MVELSVVVTIYNAEAILPLLVKRLISSVSVVTESFELIFVEDRGKDGSWAQLRTLCTTDTRIKAVRMARNFGQHNAITAGLHLSQGNYVVLMDGDLQDEPEVIPGLYKSIKDSTNQIVYVRRMNRKDSFFKKVTSKIFTRAFAMLSGMDARPEIGTFRIMTRLVNESFRKFPEVDKYVGGLFNWMQFEEGYFDAEHAKRAEGRSSYNLAKLLKLATNGIVSFSNKPLSFAMYVGLISSFGSILLGLLFVYRKLAYNVNITGYSSLIVSIYFLGGLILFVLGIIGQYIGRIFDQVKKRPEYLLQEKINF